MIHGNSQASCSWQLLTVSSEILLGNMDCMRNDLPLFLVMQSWRHLKHCMRSVACGSCRCERSYRSAWRMIVCTPDQPELMEALKTEDMSPVAIRILVMLPFTAH